MSINAFESQDEDNHQDLAWRTSFKGYNWKVKKNSLKNMLKLSFQTLRFLQDCSLEFWSVSNFGMECDLCFPRSASK